MSKRPAGGKFSALALFKKGLTGRDWPKVWRQHELGDSYDVVIIGGGLHGLATAHYLAENHGITNVAVLEKAYIGSGGSGRNTAIIRSNYLTPEGVAFYNRSVHLFERLSTELNFNVMFEQRGHMTLAHSDSSLRTMRWRAEVNKVQKIDSEVIYPDEIKKLVPFMDVSTNARYPILGALWHPPGGIARHDAVVWTYARAADAAGVHIHQKTELTGIDVEGGKVVGVQTSRGKISTPVVVNCTAGWASTISDMAGVKMPIHTRPPPSGGHRAGENRSSTLSSFRVLFTFTSARPLAVSWVFGAATDPFDSYSTRGTLDFIEGLAGHVLELMPGLSKMRLLRQWSGLCDMTPDYSPIIGPTPVGGFYVDVGWGTYGFKAGPVAGEQTAEAVATGRVPKLIEAFQLDRFERGTLTGEKGAAAVGH